MYGCESLTITKAEHRRMDAFELCYWRRLLRVPWTARRSNQSILKEISPGCSMEGLMLKMKLQSFGHLMQRTDSLKRPWCLEWLEAEGEGDDDRGWGGWMASLTQWTWVWVDSGSWWWTERPGMLPSMGSQRVGHDWATELNWNNAINLAFPCTCVCFKMMEENSSEFSSGDMVGFPLCSLLYLPIYLWWVRINSNRLKTMKGY